jgi:hypothetical protein
MRNNRMFIIANLGKVRKEMVVANLFGNIIKYLDRLRIIIINLSQDRWFISRILSKLPPHFPLGEVGGWWLGREADHSLSSSAEVRNVWCYTSPPNMSSWCGGA